MNEDTARAGEQRPVERSETVGTGGADGDFPYIDDNELMRIRAKIEQTELEMLDTLNAIEERISFEQLRKAAEEKVSEVVLNGAKELAGTAGHAIEEASNTLVEMIKENPVSSALIGLGVGWLFMREWSDLSGEKDRNVHKDSGPGVERELTEPAFVEGSPAKAGSARGKERLKPAVSDNVAALSFAALAIGAAVGLSLFRSEQKGGFKGKMMHSNPDMERGYEERTEGTREEPSEETYGFPHLTQQEARLAIEEGWQNCRL